MLTAVPKALRAQVLGAGERGGVRRAFDIGGSFALEPGNRVQHLATKSLWSAARIAAFAGPCEVVSPLTVRWVWDGRRGKIVEGRLGHEPVRTTGLRPWRKLKVVLSFSSVLDDGSRATDALKCRTTLPDEEAIGISGCRGTFGA